MTSAALAATFAARMGSASVERAIDEAKRLLLSVEAHAVVLSELGAIELPPAIRAEPTQMRAVASLYLASTLEAAGLIEAADDLTRLVRTGALPGDLGAAARLVEAFWDGRNDRTSTEERSALFGRLFGAPTGPPDAAGVNDAFEERLLDLCEAVIDAAETGSHRRVRGAGERLAENVAGAANDMVLLMARDIMGSLSEAIAILNHPQVRAMLMARTLWDAVAAIDRRFHRPARPTLSYLRRGRAGMTVLAWLADMLDGADDAASVRADDSVIDAAVSWVDETLSIIRAEEAAGAPESSAGMPGATSGAPAWLDLART